MGNNSFRLKKKQIDILVSRTFFLATDKNKSKTNNKKSEGTSTGKKYLFNAITTHNVHLNSAYDVIISEGNFPST